MYVNVHLCNVPVKLSRILGGGHTALCCSLTWRYTQQAQTHWITSNSNDLHYNDILSLFSATQICQAESKKMWNLGIFKQQIETTECLKLHCRMQPQTLLKPIRAVRRGFEAAAWKDDVSISIRAHMTEHMLQPSFPSLALSLLLTVHIALPLSAVGGYAVQKETHTVQHTIWGNGKRDTHNTDRRDGHRKSLCTEWTQLCHLYEWASTYTHTGNVNSVCRHIQYL